MTTPEKERYLKAKYHEARELRNTKEYGKERHETKYSFAMLSALCEMAREDVYPDGTFGDEECNVWEMFCMMKFAK